MIIYFSHSVSDYNTDYEQKCIKKINEKFQDCTIINPKNITLSNEESKKIKGNYNNFMEAMSKYFNEINICDILISFPNSKGTLTSGTVTEINYCKKINKPFEIMSALKNVIGEEWQRERISFYNNSKATPFIEKYFRLKKGVRAVVCHPKDYTSPSYYEYGINSQRMRTIGNINYLSDFYCVHSFMYTFDKRITDYYPVKNRIEFAKNNITGINAVIELDAPNENESEKSNRIDFFTCISSFNNSINTIDKMLYKLGEDYNLMFSGNGIYFILKGWYEDNVKAYSDDFIRLLDNLKETELGNKLKVHVDNNDAPWNDYFKIPFTFHEKKPRISCPIPNVEIDSEWLYRVSNIDNILSDYSIIDEIIKKSKWKKLW